MIIQNTFGIKKEPFKNNHPHLLEQQQKIVSIIKAQSQHGGFAVITGDPGVGKTAIRHHIQQLEEDGSSIVVSFSRTMHTYTNILKQLAESMKISISDRKLEREILHTAHKNARDRKTIYTIIDEAHLINITCLRKLRLLFDQFPNKHNLVLFGQRELMYFLSMSTNDDIKSRVTYSEHLYALNEFQILD